MILSQIMNVISNYSQKKFTRLKWYIAKCFETLITKRDLSNNLRNPSTFVKEKANTIRYGTESIRILGPKIWDIIPDDIKNADCVGLGFL